ncbi:MAG: MBL fold metallo-hydrolase, partial [Bacillota bacterium]|nr:MBL fold metallo-hydrolase [Bacillota bacterium]
PEDKKIVVFSSHSHMDHFNPVILNWQSKRPDIEYVLSSDIEVKGHYHGVHTIAPYEKAEVGPVTVKSFGSTDIGVSYLVEVGGINIFHAGDLNWWYWWDDTEAEIKKAESWFKDEISRLEGEKVDIAFFPVDPRLEHNYCMGAKYFIDKLKPEILFPMHFGNSYKTTVKFKEEVKNSGTRVMEIEKRGQEFELSL